MKKGILISFEGPEGAGKSTVMEKLLPILKEKQEVITSREPGGIPIGEQIRSVILNPENAAMDGKTELLLYIASRRQHLIEKILPALAEGKLVLMDRFIDSSVAYQGFGRGLSVEDIEWLNDFATDGLKPDLTLYYDLDVAEGLARIERDEKREINRLDLETLDMHQRVRQGYLSLLEKDNSNRLVKIDASQSLEQVIEDSLQIMQERFQDLT